MRGLQFGHNGNLVLPFPRGLRLALGLVKNSSSQSFWIIPLHVSALGCGAVSRLVLCLSYVVTVASMLSNGCLQLVSGFYFGIQYRLFSSLRVSAAFGFFRKVVHLFFILYCTRCTCTTLKYFIVAIGYW